VLVNVFDLVDLSRVVFFTVVKLLVELIKSEIMERLKTVICEAALM
jgi:hypothetical protein